MILARSKMSAPGAAQCALVLDHAAAAAAAAAAESSVTVVTASEGACRLGWNAVAAAPPAAPSRCPEAAAAAAAPPLALAVALAGRGWNEANCGRASVGRQDCALPLESTCPLASRAAGIEGLADSFSRQAAAHPSTESPRAIKTCHCLELKTTVAPRRSHLLGATACVQGVPRECCSKACVAPPTGASNT